MMVSDSAVSLPSPVVTPLDGEIKWTRQGSGYSEAHTFYIFPSTGGAVYIQVAYSEVALSPISQVTLRVSNSNVNFFKSFNFSGRDLVVGPRPNTLVCKDFSIKPTASGGVEVSLKSREATMQFTWAPRSPAVQVGDGEVKFGTAAHILSQQFDLVADVKGTILLPSGVVDLSGIGAIVHQYQGIAPHKLASQWDFFCFQSPSLGVSTISGLTPADSFGPGSAHFSTLALRHDGKDYVSTSTTVTHTTTRLDDATGYAVPSSAMIKSTWTDADGAEMALTATLNQLRDAHVVDVLAELPWLIRKAIQLLVSKPMVYQFVEQCDVVLTRNGIEVARESGTCFFETTFTNPK